LVVDVAQEIRERQREGIAIAKGKGSTPAESHRCHQLARLSCGGELPMVTRRLRLLVSSASAGIRYIGMFRSKSAGLGSLEHELRAANQRRETMSESEMQAELERLRAENAQLKSKDKGGLSLKVSEKGGVSLYGMGRFPVTLYKEQWLRILASAPEIEAFIRENDHKLKTKE
jgi:hypothetical protein